VGCHIVIGPEMPPHPGEQFLLDCVRLGERAAGEDGLLVQYLRRSLETGCRL
jgi:hypothetical protein